MSYTADNNEIHTSANIGNIPNEYFSGLYSEISVQMWIGSRVFAFKETRFPF